MIFIKNFIINLCVLFLLTAPALAAVPTAPVYIPTPDISPDIITQKFSTLTPVPASHRTVAPGFVYYGFTSPAVLDMSVVTSQKIQGLTGGIQSFTFPITQLDFRSNRAGVLSLNSHLASQDIGWSVDFSKIDPHSALGYSLNPFPWWYNPADPIYTDHSVPFQAQIDTMPQVFMVEVFTPVPGTTCTYPTVAEENIGGDSSQCSYTETISDATTGLTYPVEGIINIYIESHVLATSATSNCYGQQYNTGFSPDSSFDKLLPLPTDRHWNGCYTWVVPSTSNGSCIGGTAPGSGGYGPFAMAVYVRCYSLETNQYIPAAPIPPNPNPPTPENIKADILAAPLVFTNYSAIFPVPDGKYIFKPTFSPYSSYHPQAGGIKDMFKARAFSFYSSIRAGMTPAPYAFDASDSVVTVDGEHPFSFDLNDFYPYFPLISGALSLFAVIISFRIITRSDKAMHK